MKFFQLLKNSRCFDGAILYMYNHMKRIPDMILYSRFRNGTPLRSKLLHCRKRWWKHATHTTARPRSSSVVFLPSTSARTGKNGPLGCVVANNLFSNPLVELLQNVQSVKAGSPLVEALASVFNSTVAMFFVWYKDNTVFYPMYEALNPTIHFHTSKSSSFMLKRVHFNLLNLIKIPVIH